MKTMKIAVSAACIALLSTASFGGIVYQDDFTDGDLTVNAGIGGGTSFDTRNYGTPVEQNGTLDTGRGTAHNNRGNTFSTSSFDLTGGFRLEMNYTTDELVGGRCEIGLVDAAAVTAASYGGYFANWLSNGNAYGIGINLPTPQADQGLNLANGSGVLTSLDAISFTAGAASFVLEVDADSNWSYSVNGGTEVSGTIAGGFDFTREYQFGTYTQNLEFVDPKGSPGLTIDSVTLTAIPEPATLGLVAMFGGAVMFIRRRFMI